MKAILVTENSTLRISLGNELMKIGCKVCDSISSETGLDLLKRQTGCNIAILGFVSIDDKERELFRGLAERGVKIIAHSHRDDVATIKEVFSLKASGYLCTKELFQVIADAVSVVNNGLSYLSPVAIERLSYMTAQRKITASEKSMSQREEQILKFLRQGYSKVEISRNLDISVRTVDSYCARVIFKLGLPGMRELRRYAICSHMSSS